jgi:hypothetical protein
MHQISAVENPAHRGEDFYDEKIETQDVWYDDVEGLGEVGESGKMADDLSDISDYEDQLKGRKRKKKETGKAKVRLTHACTYANLPL